MACTNRDEASCASLLIPTVPNKAIRAKQLDLLYRYALTGMTVNVLNAVIVAAVLWAHAPRKLIVAWCVTYIVVALGRLMLARMYCRAADKDSQRWAILFSLGAACAGAVWGAIGIIAPVYLSQAYQVFVAFAVGGMAIGAMAMSGAFLPAYVAFMLPALGCLALGFLLHAGNTYVAAMAALVIVSIVALYLMGRNVNKSIVKSICLSLERDELKIKLSAINRFFEKNSGRLNEEILERTNAEQMLQKLNAQLEHRVAGRTAELDRMVGKLAEEVAERESAERGLRMMADALPVHLAFVDTSLRYRFSNAGYAKVFGVTVETVSGRHLHELIGDSLFATVKPYVDAALAGEHQRFEIEIPVAGDGSDFMDVQYIPSREENGEIDGFYCLCMDITERKVSEQARERLLAIIDASTDLVSTADAQGNVMTINAAGRRMVGLAESDDIAGTRIADYHPAEAMQFLEQHALPAAVRNGTWIGENVFLARDGHEIATSQLLIAHKNSAGEMENFSTVARDISSQKQTEQALRKAKEQAERVNVTKTRFLAAASHDLRQPLQSVQSYLGVLSESVSQDNILMVIEKMGNSVLAMRELLDALLDVSRLDSGKVQPDVIDFQIAEIFDAVASRINPLAREKSLGLRILASSCRIRSDRVLLERIVENFVHNAIRYTDSGRIVLGCRRRGEYLRIEVWDTGIGIPNYALETIFEEFTQLHNPARDRRKGLGLGLAIVHRLARILGHHLDVTSIPGKGSMFAVVVPLALGQVQEMQSRVPIETLICRDKTRGSILLVEDDPAVLESTRLLLRRRGFNVATATSGDEAIVQIKHKFIEPDVILSDYHLPGGETGIDVVRRIRNVVRDDTPAIMLTGDIEQIGGANVGGVQILHKPIESDKLVTAICRKIGEKSAQNG